MKLNCKGSTNPGMVRTNNEDYFACFPDYSLFIVADGMGGHNAGEVASKTAVESIHSYFVENIKQIKSAKIDVVEFIKKAIRHANRVVFQRAQKNPEEEGMGTTVVVFFFYNSKAYIGWVGDSRAYISRIDIDGKRFISQITTDHSLVQEQITEGIITQEDADKYNIKDIITRAVGFNPEVEADCVMLKELHKGDIFMACSDGYYRYFKLVEIGNVFLQFSSDEIAEEMVKQACNSGGEDNVTILTVYVEEV